MLSRSILVGVYDNSLQAGLGQALLEEEGIAGEIENLTSQSWLAGDVPLTGFRLMVPYADAQRALAVLGRKPFGPAPERSGSPPEPPAGDDAAAAHVGAEDDEQALDNREARGPMAALSLGMSVSMAGLLTLLAAAVWTLSLLADRAGGRLTGRARFLLVGGLLLFGTGIVVLNAVWWRHLPAGPGWFAWVRLGVDIVVAFVVFRGYVSARRRWRAG